MNFKNLNYCNTGNTYHSEFKYSPRYELKKDNYCQLVERRIILSKCTEFLARTHIHKEVVFETLGITTIPKGYHIHHKDCDRRNNVANNLVLLTTEDHMWLHKNFGNAVLWAIMHGKITAEQVSKWCTLPDKALSLISLTLSDQIGVIKSGELPEHHDTV